MTTTDGSSAPRGGMTTRVRPGLARSSLTTVCAWRSARPFVVTLLEHAEGLRCAALLPECPEEVSRLECCSPNCCDASQRATYYQLICLAEKVRRWKMMLETEAAVAMGIAKAGPDFVMRVRRSIRVSVEAASELWKSMYAVSLLARPTPYELAPPSGGAPRPVDDIMTALPPDVLALVLACACQQRLEAREPVGNICALRRTCVAFAKSPVFEPFSPRLVVCPPLLGVPTRPSPSFPHWPRADDGSVPAMVCTDRELRINLRVSLPGDPASERLLCREGGPFHGGVDLTLRLQTTHPDGSVHDITERLAQRSQVSNQARKQRFCVEGCSPGAQTSLRFGLLSSTIGRELFRRHTRPREAPPPAASPSTNAHAYVQPRSMETETASRALRLERGELLSSAKRVRTRRSGREAPPAPLTTTPPPPPPPPTTGARAPMAHFHLDVRPSDASDRKTHHLHWTSEGFGSVYRRTHR